MTQKKSRPTFFLLLFTRIIIYVKKKNKKKIKINQRVWYPKLWKKRTSSFGELH